MGKRWVCAFSLAFAGCGQTSSGDDPTPAPALINYPDVSSPSAPATPTIYEPPKPNHFYDERRGETYFYVAAVSENDRENGRAVGNVHQFQYLGRNSDGEFILASLSDNGAVSYRAKCALPCRIIDTTYGGKIAFSTSSIIGAAFQDAFNGELQIVEWAAKERQSNPVPIPASTTSTVAPSDPPVTTPPMPSAAATLPPLDPRFVEPASQPLTSDN